MTDILHVILGRYGDLILTLPALKRWADTHGKPAAVLTSHEFLPLFEGCSYVKAVALECEFRDLKSVLNYLKTDLPAVNVKCLQFYQSGEQKVLPSFWHEQMYLAGLLDGKDEPLVFDRRDIIREAKLIGKHGDQRRTESGLALDWGRPMILLGLDGKSSPLPCKDWLSHTLWAEFGAEYNIVDLSEVKAERIYDLLGLYDHAAALITIDTVHAHLSKASKVPVFMLARDEPTRWHGTPQQDRFTWYCRYGQVMERAEELIETLRNILSGVHKPKPEFLPLPKGAYNPSIIVHNGEELISYRHHPDKRNWRTQLVLDGLPVKFPHPVSTCAHEDMRLFTFQGNLWTSYVCSRGTRENPRCITGYGELIYVKSHHQDERFWAIKEHFQPDMPGNDWSGMQKNMVCFECSGGLWALWDNKTYLSLIPKRDYCAVGSIEQPATWPYGEIRGGTSPLPFRGKWLRFFHSRVWDRENEKPWRYHIGALIMESYPPFNVIQVSSKPILSGDESGDPMIPHYKHSVCICYGAIQDGDEWVVSLGINDAHSALLRLKEEDLNL